MTAHAKLSASGSEKWFNCAASASMEEVHGEDSGSSFASEGTAAHEVGEQCLKKGLDPASFVGEMILVNEGQKDECEILCDQEMAENVQKYINYVQSHGGTTYVEEKVDYSRWVPEGYGTSDAITEALVVRADREGNQRRVNTLYVDDLKYGKGIMVSAFENKQGMCYALGSLDSLGFLFEHDIELVEIAIIQPRKDNISVYEIWVDELIEWADTEVRPRAALAWDLLEKTKANVAAGDKNPLAHVKPSHFVPTKKGCRWCKVSSDAKGAGKGKCKKQITKGYEAAVSGFEDMTDEEKLDIESVEVTKDTLRDLNTLTNEEIAKIYSKDMPMLLSWFGNLKDRILDGLMKGEAFPGLKPVRGNGKRVWTLDDEGATAAMRSQGLMKKHYEVMGLISPTTAEKELKALKPKDHAKRYKKLARVAIEVTEGSPTVAPEYDKRDSIAPVIEAELTEETTLDDDFDDDFDL